MHVLVLNTRFAQNFLSCYSVPTKEPDTQRVHFTTVSNFFPRKYSNHTDIGTTNNNNWDRNVDSLNS